MKPSYVVSSYSKFNLLQSVSDVQVFMQYYKKRINAQLQRDLTIVKTEFVSFAEKKVSIEEMAFIQDNTERFIKDTPNEDNLVTDYYQNEFGHIYSMVYSPDGHTILLGFSSGLIQVN